MVKSLTPSHHGTRISPGTPFNHRLFYSPFRSLSFFFFFVRSNINNLLYFYQILVTNALSSYSRGICKYCNLSFLLEISKFSQTHRSLVTSIHHFNHMSKVLIKN